MCKGCSTPKFNPCPCGSLKYRRPDYAEDGTPIGGDPEYEIDKFDDVVQMMDGGLVVSLDSELATLKRVWVVAEIAEVPLAACIFRMLSSMTTCAVAFQSIE